jgi:hypothetical protein
MGIALGKQVVEINGAVEYRTQAERFPFWFYKKLLQKVWVMSLSDFKMENPLGLPILPHLRRQISSRIGDYSGKTSSLVLRQARQSLSLGTN